MKKILLLLLLAGLGVLVWKNHTPKNTLGGDAPPVVTVAQKMTELLTAYEALHPQPDHFWLTGGDQLMLIGAPAYNKLLQTWKADAIAGLRRNMEAHPLMHDLMSEFPDFRITEVVRQGNSYGSRAVFPGKIEGNIEQFMQEQGKFLEVALIPEQNWDHSAFPSCLYYNKGWGAVMVVGVDIPATFGTALLAHELGHALRHRQGAGSATAHPSTDLFIGEEVEMHVLEHEVLNFAVQGKFNQLLDRIIARAANKQDMNQVIKSVTAEDLKAYDQLFGLESAGKEIASLALGQFLLSLGFRMIDGYITEPQAAHAEKIRFYRWISNPAK